MSVSVSDILRVQGDTYPVECTILKADGTPYDLTGVTEVKLGVATAKSLAVTETPTFVVTGSVVSASLGTVQFPMSPTEADIPVAAYYGEIQLLDGGYIVTTEKFRYHVVGQIIY